MTQTAAVKPAGPVKTQPGDEGHRAEVVEISAGSGLPRGAQKVVSTGRTPIYAVTNPAADGYGLWFTDGPCSPLPYLHGVLARRDASGTQRGVMYLLSASPEAGSARHVVTDKELAGGGWISDLFMAIPEDKPIKEAVTTVIRGLAKKMTPIEAEARWVGDRLEMPPAEVLPAGYLEVAGSEVQARAAWREVAELASLAGAENLALNLGASWAAPYVRPMSVVRPVSALFAGTGAPRKGKSTNVNAAAAMYGSPIRINPPLSESSIAVGDQLASLGCLPFFRDEVHSAGWNPGQWKTYVMRTLNGAGRRRSNADGSGQIKSSREWWGFQFMSGNIDPRYGSTDGVQARVVALGDPHLPNGAVSKRVTVLLGQSYGWPFRWFLSGHLSPAEFRARAEIARVELEAEAGALDGAAETVAETLAMAVAGAEVFGDLVGVPTLRAGAIMASLRVLDTLSNTLADQFARFDDLLYEAVWSDVTDHPGLWPTKKEHEDAIAGAPYSRKGSDLHGYRHQLPDGRDVFSMSVKPFRELVQSLELATDQALSDLKARGILVATRGMGNQHKVSVAGLGKVNTYTFVVPNEDSERSVPSGTKHDSTVGTGSDLRGTNGTNGTNQESRVRSEESSGEARTTEPVPPRPPAHRCSCTVETWCAPGREWPAPVPCEWCGALTVTESACGSMRHAVCADAGAVVTVETPAEAEAPIRTPDQHRPSQRVSDDDGEAFNTWAIREYPGSDQATRDAAHALWLASMRGVTFRGAHATARAILRGALKHKKVPQLPEGDAAVLEYFGTAPKDRWRAKSWTTYAELAEGQTVAEVDVNGMYLGSAEILLGTGALTVADALTPEMLNLPGWARFASVPADLPHGLGGRIVADMNVPMPIVSYLAGWAAKHGTVLDVNRVAYWPASQSRKWLRPHAGMLRTALYKLTPGGVVPADGTPEHIARRAVKQVYTRMTGGLLRSATHNAGTTLRPDWSALIEATGQARMFRALDAVDVPVIGIHVDAAWLVVDADDVAPVPTVAEPVAEWHGLTISTQLGKFKAEGRAVMGPEQIRPYRTGQWKPIRDALHE